MVVSVPEHDVPAVVHDVTVTEHGIPEELVPTHDPDAVHPPEHVDVLVHVPAVLEVLCPISVPLL